MEKNEKRPSPAIIGWREWLSLPKLNLPGIKAKVDTGARSSALHTQAYELFEREGKPWVKLQVRPLTKRDDLELLCEAPILEFREVKDSGGHTEVRPFIRTRAKIGDRAWDIDISLTSRENMRFRMLLGREALAGTFLVDPSASYRIGKSLARKYKR